MGTLDIEAIVVSDEIAVVLDNTSVPGPPGGGGGSGAWGGITGTLADQADLSIALSGKAPALTDDENYVTDTDKSNLHAPGSDNQDLSGLEPKITIKGTAFNKDFGTTAGTIMAGDTAIPAAYNDAAVLASLTGKANLHGFENQTDTTLPTPYTGTNVFTLTRVNDFSVWFNGVKNTYTAANPKSIDIGLTAEWLGYTADQRKGQWFIFMYANGTLGASKTMWDILNTSYTPIATNHFDGTEWIPAEERHGIDRVSLLWHSETHKSYGAAYQSGFTASPTFGAGAANTFSFTGGTTSDEGLASVTSGAQTTCRIGYRVTGGASMTWDASGTAYAKVTASKPQYDDAGTVKDIPVGNYGCYFIYQTNRTGATNKITSIMGQATYATSTLADATSLPTLAGLSVAEWKLLYVVVVQNLANALKFISVKPVYQLSTGPAINAGAASTVAAGNVTYVPTTATGPVNAQSALDSALNQTIMYNSPGVQTVNTGVTRRTIIRSAVLISGTAAINTAPTGASITGNIRKNGTTTIGTFTIAAGAYSGAVTISSGALANGDYLTVDITQIGSTVAGSDMTMSILATLI